MIYGRITNKQLINEDLESGSIDVIERIYWHLLGCIDEYHEHLHYDIY